MTPLHTTARFVFLYFCNFIILNVGTTCNSYYSPFAKNVEIKEKIIMENMLELEKIGIEVDEIIPYTIIENYIFDIEGLSANKKLFILMIRRYVGTNKNHAFPSYSKLMKHTGCGSRTTIAKSIDFFIWLNWIERINRTDEKGEKISNYYMLSLKNIRSVLEHLDKKKKPKEKNYNFSELEKYFEENYYIGQNNKKIVNKEFLKMPCKYLIE